VVVAGAWCLSRRRRCFRFRSASGRENADEEAHHIAARIVNACVTGRRGVAFRVTAARWNRWWEGNPMEEVNVGTIVANLNRKDRS
jgi:hypothetical protein